MVRAIRQSVIVTPGGVVELRFDELRPGLTAEVIVLVDSPPQPAGPGGDRLAQLDAAQQAANLTPEAASAWVRSARRERTPASRRREPRER